MANDVRSRFGRWLRPAVYLGQNTLSEAGAVLTTSSAFTLIGFWLMELGSRGPVHPYAGILFFLLLPGLFVLGLVLMPVGIILKRRKLRAAGELPDEYPTIDLKRPLLRRAAIIVGALTTVNVLIMGIASYRGVEYMDSREFCGKTCHTVMQPEYTAYLSSPHSRVECVACHIGPGAPWFVKSKLSGTRQLFAVAFKTYERPIKAPVKQLRPARDTCEQCHWPQKFHGDKFLVRKKFQDDEKNSALTTVLVLRIGGGFGTRASGIHGRHLDEKSRVTYTAIDDRRQVISKVSYIDDNGKTVDYASTDPPPKDLPKVEPEVRAMDCVDCHNRPTHIYELPERAVDHALQEGRISTELPFVKKKGVELLRSVKAPEEIATSLTAYYRETHPDVFNKRRDLVEGAIRELTAIYGRNVFPEMKVTWGTYPNNIGHEDFPGCFRCHDGSHKNAEGKVIASECDTCHYVLAMEESNPKVLADLGLK